MICMHFYKTIKNTTLITHLVTKAFHSECVLYINMLSLIFTIATHLDTQ